MQWTRDRAPDDCLARNEWICGAYLSTRSQILVDATVQHLQYEVLTTADLPSMNGQVDSRRRLAQDVARRYLQDKGLLK